MLLEHICAERIICRHRLPAWCRASSSCCPCRAVGCHFTGGFAVRRHRKRKERGPVISRSFSVASRVIRRTRACPCFGGRSVGLLRRSEKAIGSTNNGWITADQGLCVFGCSDVVCYWLASAVTSPARLVQEAEGAGGRLISATDPTRHGGITLISPASPLGGER